MLVVRLVDRKDALVLRKDDWMVVLSVSKMVFAMDVM